MLGEASSLDFSARWLRESFVVVKERQAVSEESLAESEVLPARDSHLSPSVVQPGSLPNVVHISGFCFEPIVANINSARMYDIRPQRNLTTNPRSMSRNDHTPHHHRN